MVDPGVPNDQRKLLTDDALKAAKARIKVTKIEEPTITGDTATIKAHLSLDGKAFTYDFTASKTSGSFGLDSWKVDKPLVVSADFGLLLASGAEGRRGLPSTWPRIKTVEWVSLDPGRLPRCLPGGGAGLVSKYLTAKETSFTRSYA